MTTLVLGANSVLSSSQLTVKLSLLDNPKQRVGAVWLALDEHRKVSISPAYLHEPKAWASVLAVGDDWQWTLDLDKVFGQGVAKLQLVLYVYDMPQYSAVELSACHLCLDGQIDYQTAVLDRHIKTGLVLEIYTYKGQYKCRALGEYGTQTLKEFGDKLGVALNEKLPSDAQLSLSPTRPQAGETWTGTAFAVDRYHLLTCHHMIDGATLIGIRQAGQADRQAMVVISDEGSDTAILRVDTPLSDPLTLMTGCEEVLGESVAVLGYPLSGLTGGLQATTGNIASLTGLLGDIRFLQFTAPIQAGSSGSPILLSTGQVVGMVTSSLSNAQNMNYAVKYQLLSALLMSAGIGVPCLSTTTAMPMPELIRRHKNAIWLVGCRA